MYGYRARIGYTSPPMLTEVFPYEFYKVVPEGVTLVLTTLTIRTVAQEEVDQSWELSMRAAREMARAEVNAIILGGGPINLRRGFDAMDEAVAALTSECGVPVSTSVTAQFHALQRLNARKVGVVLPPYAGESSGRVRDLNAGLLQHHGLEAAGFVEGGGAFGTVAGRVPLDAPLKLARELVRQHPEIDTILLPGPHYPVAGSVEAIEQELGVGVVSALLAITWEALRLAGIKDRIDGYGRLLREF